MTVTLTFPSLSATSDQPQEGDGVYKALIRYVAHLGRRAKRKAVVSYHQWRERRAAAKAAALENAQFTEEHQMAITTSGGASKEGGDTQGDERVRRRPSSAVKSEGGESGKKKRKRRKKRRELMERRQSRSQSIRDGRQHPPGFDGTHFQVVVNPDRQITLHRRYSLAPEQASYTSPPKASPEMSEVDSQRTRASVSSTMAGTSPMTVAIAHRSLEAVYPSHLHPSFSPPLPHGAHQHPSRESSISYYTAVDDPSSAGAAVFFANHPSPYNRHHRNRGDHGGSRYDESRSKDKKAKKELLNRSPDDEDELDESDSSSEATTERCRSSGSSSPFSNEGETSDDDDDGEESDDEAEQNGDEEDEEEEENGNGIKKKQNGKLSSGGAAEQKAIADAEAGGEEKVKNPNICQRFQARVKQFVDGDHFTRGILVAILVNTLSMGVEYHNQVRDALLSWGMATLP